MTSLEGKRALVTGGSRGIGRAISRRLAAAGADVLIDFLRDDEAARSAKAELSAIGRRVETIRANVGDPADVDRLVEAVSTSFEPLDIFVSNAALGVFKPALEIRQKDWQWTLDISAYAFLRLVQRLSSLMRNGDSSVIAISSLGATRAIPGYAAMGAAKASLESLARHLAVELAPRGVRVNVVSAGLVRTDSLRYLSGGGELAEAATRRTPAGRLATPEDVADAVLFLASPEARMIYGQTIVVDGGYSILA